MDITQTPNLKPLRSYSEHEVIEFFAHEDASANKGSLVAVTVAQGNTNVFQNAANPPTPHVDIFDRIANVPSRANAYRHEVTWKVKNAISGDVPLGMLLFDVREVNSYGEKLIFKPRHERYEKDLVVSGEAVPVLTRGFVKINGFNGVPGPGSGAEPSSTDSGYLDVTFGIGADNVGKFLTTADADGYALFKLEL